MIRSSSSNFIAIALAVFLWLLILPGVSEAAGEGEASPPELIIHRVQAGETLEKIAANYNVSPQSLMELNGLRRSNAIRAGQRLVVSRPSSSEESNQDKRGGRVHIVRRGQTLSGIAARYGVTVGAIKRANKLRTNTIYVGQRLRIPASGSPSSQGGVIHIVRRGETLAAIANRYGVSVRRLARLNGISNTSLIRVGQRLIITPAGEQSGKKGPRGPKKIVVDISEQRCWRYEGDRLLNTWRCSTARKGYATRTGTFRVQSKLRKAYGSTWNIWMPYWLGIYWSGRVENGFHGLPWNATTGARTWAGMVGTPITYGCIMLTDKAMKQLWEWADIGTKVVIRR
ncbi:MAG: LysM peptidoglycan-binding domain-containing protein [Chloroflexi bacterium]|nr:LysM peptidoglycan-binding domain-containing protein [Chloroflexota bacterium]